MKREETVSCLISSSVDSFKPQFFSPKKRAENYPTDLQFGRRISERESNAHSNAKHKNLLLNSDALSLSHTHIVAFLRFNHCFLTVMDSILLAHFQTVVPRSGVISAIHHQSLPCTLAHYSRLLCCKPVAVNSTSPRRRLAAVASSATADTANSVPLRERTYNVGDFMTRKESLHVVKPTTTVDEALETIVEKRITGFPVIDDDWKLVGVISDYDILALDTISGGGQHDTNMFPDVDSSWKSFNEIQKLLNKTYGKVVGDLMTDAPLVVRETTNLEDAVRLLLITKYHRLPVVDGSGKLVGIITRGDVVRAALQIKRDSEKM